MSGPLTGVKIIDITTVVMGPYATQILGELGAEIIKVESPEGDNTRHSGPMKHPGMGHMFLHLNRNKKSIVLDLKRPVGREALLRLVAGADVLIYNIRPQAMARLALTYSDVADVNPRIIYVGTYGFGQTGPYAAKPAYDDLIQGMVGIPWLMARSGASEPRFVPSTLADRIVGLHAVYAVTAALYHREKSGRGQSIEVPMFESMTHLILGDHLGGRTFEPPLGPAGYARVLAAHRKPFATRDGYLCLLIYNDKQWKNFFRLLGREDMYGADPRFSSHENRARHTEEITQFVAAQLKTRTSAEWLLALADSDIPVTEMNSVDDLIGDPHLAATGFVICTQHPSEGTLRTTTAPVRWSDSSTGLRLHAPSLGEHSVEILRTLGYSDDEITAMLTDGVTRTPEN